MPASGAGFEPFARGSSLTEYLIVLLGFTIVFTSLDDILALIREHHNEFSAALQLPF